MVNSERYFPDFKFKFTQRFSSQDDLRNRHTEDLADSDQSKRDQFCEDATSQNSDTHESLLAGWSWDSVLFDYTDVLGLIRNQERVPLTRHKRGIKLVSRTALIPQSKYEREELKRKYGPNILNVLAGDCRRLPDGRFKIRIGYAGEENSATKAEVLSVTAHEHGHTLGKHIDWPIYEEMKAYAFETLFMSYYWNVGGYVIRGENPNSLHDRAKNSVAQLLERGIKEQEILAHLTQESFGFSRPYDYQRYIGRRTFNYRK